MEFSILGSQFSINKVVLIIFIIGLLYILVPGPSKIEDFAPIPDSLKSDEPGDTYQNPNIAAYFSQFDRKGITQFYKKDYRDQFLFGRILPIVSLNYPPEAAWQYVRDMQKSTFLEEYVYPLRGSLFVNGHEPYTEIELLKLKHDPLGDRMQIKGNYYKSKTTLRFHPNSWFDRSLVYIGIWLSGFGIFILAKKVIKEI